MKRSTPYLKVELVRLKELRMGTRLTPQSQNSLVPHLSQNSQVPLLSQNSQVPHQPESSEMAQLHGSPETICVICLDRIQDKSYLNNCLHQFCFPCLLKWSEVKTTCPLCQQKFESAMHNVRSDKDYDVHTFGNKDKYDVMYTYIDLDSSPIRVGGDLPGTDFGYEDELYVPTYIIVVDFRRYVYENHLVSMPLHSILRETVCTPQYISSHQEEMRIRLVPWLSRELGVVMNVRSVCLITAINSVLEHASRWHMLTSQFRDEVAFCTNEKKALFCWELYNFASSSCNMIQFDKDVKYVRPPGLDVPPNYQQFFASPGMTNPIVSLASPSLLLSPTVQSPVRSISSADSVCLESESDSDEYAGANLYFKTSKCQRSYDGLALESSCCRGPPKKQASRSAKFNTEFSRWSSDLSECASIDTYIAVKNRRKRLTKKKNSRRDFHLKPVSLRSAISKCKTRERGESSIAGEGQEPSTSSHMVGVTGFSSCESRSFNGQEVVSDQDVPSVELNRSLSSSPLLVENVSVPRSKRARPRRNVSSSDDSVADDAPSMRRKRMREVPVPYYQQGITAFISADGGPSVSNVMSPASHVGKLKNKRRISSVIVKPSTSSK